MILIPCSVSILLRCLSLRCLAMLNDDVVNDIISEPGTVFNILMGKHATNAQMVDMIKIWLISSKHICRMYNSATIRELD